MSKKYGDIFTKQKELHKYNIRLLNKKGWHHSDKEIVFDKFKNEKKIMQGFPYSKSSKLRVKLLLAKPPSKLRQFLKQPKSNINVKILLFRPGLFCLKIGDPIIYHTIKKRKIMTGNKDIIKIKLNIMSKNLLKYF